MNKLRFPIIAVTLFMLIYNTLPFLGTGDNWIIALFIISPFPVIWMAYRILKDGTPSGKTWDDHFYEDHAYRRNGKEELSSQ
jgi:hypothetical protein